MFLSILILALRFELCEDYLVNNTNALFCALSAMKWQRPHDGHLYWATPCPLSETVKRTNAVGIGAKWFWHFTSRFPIQCGNVRTCGLGRGAKKVRCGRGPVLRRG